MAEAPAYYNEIDEYAAQWLLNLIAAGHLPAGDVDTRSIADVHPDDLAGYRQCHFFAGIGGWALAARLAGWPDDREIWTGSCPCQPYSAAGKQRGADDDRDLWPHQFRLIRARRPALWFGEQVAAAIGMGWLDRVLADLEGISYAGRAVVLPACAVDAPHRRDRVWIVADRDGALDHGVGARLEGHARDDGAASGRAEQDRPAAATGRGSDVANSSGDGQFRGAQRDRDAQEPGQQASCGHHVDGCGLAAGRDRSAWGGASWIVGHDGKARRVEPGIRLLAHGVPARVGRLRAYGNAIVPQVAAEVIRAYVDCAPAEALRAAT